MAFPAHTLAIAIIIWYIIHDLLRFAWDLVKYDAWLCTPWQVDNLLGNCRHFCVRLSNQILANAAAWPLETIPFSDSACHMFNILPIEFDSMSILVFQHVQSWSTVRGVLLWFIVQCMSPCVTLSRFVEQPRWLFFYSWPISGRHWKWWSSSHCLHGCSSKRTCWRPFAGGSCIVIWRTLDSLAVTCWRECTFRATSHLCKALSAELPWTTRKSIAAEWSASVADKKHVASEWRNISWRQRMESSMAQRICRPLQYILRDSWLPSSNCGAATITLATDFLVGWQAAWSCRATKVAMSVAFTRPRVRKNNAKRSILALLQQLFS